MLKDMRNASSVLVKFAAALLAFTATAAAHKGARPRLVCSMTPVALMTPPNVRDESAAALFDDMSRAKNTLDICTYILGNDAFGRDAIHHAMHRLA